MSLDRRKAAVLDGGEELPARALRDLTLMLEAAGLAAFLAAFPPHSTRADRWRREAEDLDAPLRALVHLFVLGQAVSAGSVPRNVVQGLASSTWGWLKARQSTTDVWSPAALASGCWQPAGLAVDHYADRTVARTARLPRPTASTFAGPVPLWRSARQRRVAPSEYPPVSRHKPRSMVSSRARVLCGDLFTPVWSSTTS